MPPPSTRSRLDPDGPPSRPVRPSPARPRRLLCAGEAQEFAQVARPPRTRHAPLEDARPLRRAPADAGAILPGPSGAQPGPRAHRRGRDSRARWEHAALLALAEPAVAEALSEPGAGGVGPGARGPWGERAPPEADAGRRGPRPLRGRGAAPGAAEEGPTRRNSPIVQDLIGHEALINSPRKRLLILFSLFFTFIACNLF